MDNDLEMMEVDCRKTRAAEEEWKRTTKNPKLESLGRSNQRLRITGKEQKGVVEDFARVRRGAVEKFAKVCGRGLTWEDFKADPDEYARWDLQRKAREKSIPEDLERPIDVLHKRFCGYWELYHQSTSKRWASEISVSLIQVEGIDAERSVLKCELYDGNKRRQYFHLKGFVAKLGGFLYWELRHEAEQAGFHGYCYHPAVEKYPGFELYGIFLSISGDDRFDYPVAAKGVLRFLGATPSEAMRHSLVDLSEVEGDPRDLLQKRVGGYLRDLQESEVVRPEVLAAVETDILPKISNIISADTVPRALSVQR
ncbi:hypothetical protein ABIB06_004078 [Bradyrhizobium sp. LB8.2]|uniref:hypothetical protein n=1 Tax=Bradyrhizobium sp. LB8.2 TaxID=3156330 RepID=UPI003391A459